MKEQITYEGIGWVKSVEVETKTYDTMSGLVFSAITFQFTSDGGKMRIDETLAQKIYDLVGDNVGDESLEDLLEQITPENIHAEIVA